MKIIQLTDLHLFHDPKGTLLGLNTKDSLRAVIKAVKEDPFAVDAFVLTGDLIQDDNPATYALLAEELAILKQPIYWLPGNHDVDALLEGALVGDNIDADKIISHDDWQIILLDSRMPDHVQGWLSKQQLQFLKNALDAPAGHYTLVALHHPPHAVDTIWLDSIGLQNSQEFLDILAAYPMVKGVIAGHVHQAFDSHYHGIQLLTCPSTCIQFKPHTDSFTLDTHLPGYRRLHLHEDGKITTSIARLKDFDMQLDSEGTGY